MAFYISLFCPFTPFSALFCPLVLNAEFYKRPRLLGLCDGETGDYGYCGESVYKPQYTQFTQKIAQSDGLQWVTIGYYE